VRRLIGVLCVLISPVAGHAQGGRLAVTGEPAAIGLSFATSQTTGLVLAAHAGPSFGLDVNDEIGGDARSWAGAYLGLGVRSEGGIGFHVSPLGAAVVAGNDYASVYPSAQLGVDYGRKRFRLGTMVRVIRVPTANSTAAYWTQWVPVRISYSLTK
jgi:hypothetical protein